MSWTDFFILALAVLRIHVLITQDHGPFNILDRFRYWVGVRPKPGADSGYITTNSFARGIMCQYCATVWYGILVVGLYTLNPVITIYVAAVLAVSMLAALLYKLV